MPSCCCSAASGSGVAVGGAVGAGVFVGAVVGVGPPGVAVTAAVPVGAAVAARVGCAAVAVELTVPVWLTALVPLSVAVLVTGGGGAKVRPRSATSSWAISPSVVLILNSWAAF